MPTMREALSSAMEAHRPQENEVENVDVHENEASTNTEQDETRVRDEKGRFVAKEKPKVEETPEITEPPEITETPAETKAETKPNRPNSWKKEYWETFDKADPNLQKYIHERETQFHEGLNQYRERAQLADLWNQAILPYQRNFHDMGLNPQQAIQSILNTESLLRYGSPDQKRQAIHNLVSTYGIDMSQPTQPQTYTPQDIERLVNERFEAVTNSQREQTAQAQLDEFMKNPPEHLQTVMQDMIKLLNAGLSDSYQDAYDKAVWNNPDLRAQIIAKQNSEAEAKKQEEARKAAEAAAAKAVSVKGTSTGASKTTSGANDRRSLLTQAFAEANGRV